MHGSHDSLGSHRGSLARRFCRPKAVLVSKELVIKNFNFAFYHFHEKCRLWLNISNTNLGLNAHLLSEYDKLAVHVFAFVYISFLFRVSFERMEIQL